MRNDKVLEMQNELKKKKKKLESLQKISILYARIGRFHREIIRIYGKKLVHFESEKNFQMNCYYILIVDASFRSFFFL